MELGLFYRWVCEVWKLKAHTKSAQPNMQKTPPKSPCHLVTQSLLMKRGEKPYSQEPFEERKLNFYSESVSMGMNMGEACYPH